MFETSPE